jgi:ParB family chromosome partitioning protein
VRRTAHLPFREAEDLIGFAHQTISKWEQRLEDEAVYKTRLFGASYKEAMASLDDSELVQQSLSNEHYTPAKYIEAARTVLGEIDLDPASCALANKTVKAAEFFAEEHNGLEREWRGRVWLNPPYGRLVGDFISKLMAEMGAGRVSAAVVLVNAHCTDTAWFQPLWDGWLCFTDHRINFTGDDERSGSTHGSVFSYFGSRKTLFKKSFLRFGSVVGRV